MGHSQRDKAINRERILQAAARLVRDQGLESVGIASLMRSVNLTHGGFYGHFDSRSALLAAALQQALEDGRAASRSATSPTPATDDRGGFEAFVRAYLSRSHRDTRQSGCAVAALASDVARADKASREVMAHHVKGFADRLAAWLGSTPDARFAVSALVGGLLLARVMVDEAESDAWLMAVKEGLLDHAATRQAPPRQPEGLSPHPSTKDEKKPVR